MLQLAQKKTIATKRSAPTRAAAAAAPASKKKAAAATPKKVKRRAEREVGGSVVWTCTDWTCVLCIAAGGTQACQETRSQEARCQEARCQEVCCCQACRKEACRKEARRNGETHPLFENARLPGMHPFHSLIPLLPDSPHPTTPPTTTPAAAGPQPKPPLPSEQHQREPRQRPPARRRRLLARRSREAAAAQHSALSTGLSLQPLAANAGPAAALAANGMNGMKTSPHCLRLDSPCTDTLMSTPNRTTPQHLDMRRCLS